jgi:hypothetical protein
LPARPGCERMAANGAFLRFPGLIPSNQADSHANVLRARLPSVREAILC